MNANSKEARPVQTLAEQISEKMLEYIAERELKPGDRMGTEKEMAEELKVGRSTVREAIKILVSRNILEVRQGSGTYVSDQKGIADDPLGLELIHDQFKLTWDLLEFRMMIEPQIAYMAALNATKEQMEELDRICEQMEYRGKTEGKGLTPDVRFHICVAEASGNLVAPNLIPIIEKAVELFIHYTKREKTPETVAKHRDIVEGIRRRDPEWARDMMSMHLMFNRQELRKAALKRGESFVNYRGFDEPKERYQK
ncbi:MAG: FadR/GntR family transcriptional regulator [Blautia sp.]